MSKQHKPDEVKGHSRRDFLKRSATAASAVVVGGLAIGRTAHAAGSDTLKIGLIGCGGRGTGAADNAMTADPNTKLIAMADIFENKAQASLASLKKRKPDQVAVDKDHCFVGFDGYKKVIDSGVDVVLIACASRFHSDYLKAAVDAGKNVFLEKPHAIDPPGIRTVQAACDAAAKKGLAVVSGLCWRYHTGVQETIQRVRDGAIGRIVAIQENYMRSPYRLEQPEAGMTEIQYQFRNWYHFNWLSGDDIAQSLLHSLDKGASLMNDEPPASAYGVGGRSSSVGTIYGDVFDHHGLVWEYPNGVRMYGFGRAQAGCYDETSDIIMGTKGIANLIKNHIQGETNWKYDGPPCNMYEAEHLAMFKSIRDGKPINNGKYMVNSVMMAILGQIVCYTGKKVTWDEAINATYRLGPENPDFNTEPPVKPDEKGIYPVAMPGITKLL